jgi:FdhE protein
LAPDEQVLAKLEEYALKATLPLSLQFLREFTLLQISARRRLSPFPASLGAQRRDIRLARGVPLIGFDNLQLDPAFLSEVAQETVGLLVRFPDIAGEVLPLVTNTASDPGAMLEEARRWFDGCTKIPAADAEPVPAMLDSIVYAAIRPYLANCASNLRNTAAQSQELRGYCPVCGGGPDFAFLHKDTGVRWLLCSRCDTTWPFKRLECPMCGTQTPDSLSYFADDSEAYRLYICDICHSYVKAIDLRKSKEDHLPPLERVLTVDMDRQAHQRGYHPCPQALWGRQGSNLTALDSRRN